MEYATLLANILVLAGLLYWYVRRCYSFFSDRGVRGPRPIYPVGDMITKMLKSSADYELDYLREYGRLYGFYIGTSPKLTTSDPAVIKQVLIKDFGKFVNRQTSANTYHEIWSENLFSVQGERKWKRIRTITSPTFTSGKLRHMQAIMTKSVDNLGRYFEQLIGDQQQQQQQGAAVDIETKEIVSGLTIDIIATTTFATETNANHPTNRNKHFVSMAMGLLNFNMYKAAIGAIVPRAVNDMLGIKHFFRQENFKFFVELTKSIVEKRIKENVQRNDLVQLLLNASVDKDALDSKDYAHLTASVERDENSPESTGKSGSVRLTHNEIIAQCMIFFVAGFETTATTLTYFFYEMAMNPAVQSRLVAVLDEALGADVDKASSEYYDKVMMGIPYLDAVVKETLRKYPPVPRLTRVVGEDTKVAGVDMPKGSAVNVSVYAVHHDPEYYPEPERYNPDRFMPENKHRLVAHTYLPFGDGPRNCVGMRFAYQEIKLCIAQVIPRFRFSPNANTPKVIKFRKGINLLSPVCSTVSVSRRR